MVDEVNPARYLVLDVETNGLKAKEDDLLSISVYKPDDGRMFDRFLPLEKQDELNPQAAAIHGIRKSDLRGKKPLSQKEVDDLISGLEMDERTILTFGGRGFDERFLRQYFGDHGLTGIDRMTFFNFQTMVHASPSRFFPASKDNLCIAFGIKGVEGTHTSANDCLLEWSLFEAMGGSHLLVDAHGQVFKLREGYIYPASYIDSYSRLRDYAGIPRRYVQAEKTFEMELSAEATRKMVKFPNNFSGNAVEHLIDSEMQARKIDSREYLSSNKMKLEYVGSFAGTAEEVPTEKRDGGGVALSSSVYEHAIAELERLGGFDALIEVLEKAKLDGGFSTLISSSRESLDQFFSIRFSEEYGALSEEMARLFRYSILTDAITEANAAVKPEIGPLIDYLHKLLGPDVMSQELVINERDNCLALCDLSSEQAVVEIKTGRQGYDLSKCTSQLYYCSNGRSCYALHVQWGGETEHGQTNTKFVVEKVTFTDEKPKRPRKRSAERTRKLRIRHAVTDWRLANPESTPEECVEALWLDIDAVRDAWPKSDPSLAFEKTPGRGKQGQKYADMVAWRKDNPTGTRIELSDATGITMSDVERWWFQAGMKATDTWKESESLACLVGDAEAIKASIADLADESNTYALWPEEKVKGLQDSVESLCQKSGFSRWDDRYSTLFLPQAFDDGQSKAMLVSGLKDLEKKCVNEIGRGVKILRIPLAKTRYKTRSYYMELDPERARITFENKWGKLGKSIAITVSERKTALIKPKDPLYGSVKPLVDKRIVRAYIDRIENTGEGELVFVVVDEPAPKFAWL